MLDFRQSTAATVVVGPILDSTGAEYTSAVIGDLSISKNGGTLTAMAAAATLTHIANGQYTLVMTTGNLDTLGRFQITCNKSTYQMPERAGMVMPASVWDALYANATNATGGLPTATGSISAFAGAISTFAGGAVSSVTGNVGGNVVGSVGSVTGAVVLDATSLRSALGMSAADLDTQLDAILAAASAGAGTGARTVTITVNDGTTALQNAVVRFTEGSNTFRALTNASGVAVFNLDDATYTVAVTKSGYTYAGTTMVVNGTETATYSMTAVSVTPPTNPDLSAVVVLCLGTDFEAESGVTIDLRIVTFPSGSTNTAYPGLKQTATSNGSGIATLEAPKGSVCEWKRGREDSWTEITIGSDDQTNVTSIIGSRY